MTKEKTNEKPKEKKELKLMLAAEDVALVTELLRKWQSLPVNNLPFEKRLLIEGLRKESSRVQRRLLKILTTMAEV